MADEEKQNSPAALSDSGAQVENAKPRFKTNKVNLLFKSSGSDSTDVTSSAEQGRTTPGPGGVHSTLAQRQGSSVQKGRFIIASKRDSNSGSMMSPGPSGSGSGPSPQHTSGTPIPDVETSADKEPLSSSSSSTSPPPASAASTEQAAEEKATPTTDNTQSPEDGAKEKPSSNTEEAAPPTVRKPSIDYSEEELTNRGISVAGRFHSASNINWEDEEEEWNPPPQTAAMGASFLSSVKPAIKPATATSIATTSTTSHSAQKLSSSAAAASSATGPKHLKPGNASGSVAGRNSSPSTSSHPTASAGEHTGVPWSQRKVVATNSLSDAIREAKEKGSAFKPGTVGRNARPQLSSGAGNDALSRFRIRSGGGAPMPFRGGAPPLNPQGAFSLLEDEPVTFQRASDRMGPATFGRGAYPSEEDVQMFSRPRMPVYGSGNSTGMPRRPIPDRLRRVSHGSEGVAQPPTHTPPQTSSSSPAAATAAAPSTTAPPAMAPSATEQTASTPSGSASKQDSEPNPSLKEEEVATTNTEDQKVDLSSKETTEKVPENTKAVATSEQPPVKGHAEDGGGGAAATATAAATAAEPVPKPAPIQEVQKQEMVSVVELAKARLEAERAAEREKERKLQEKREQMRKELEEKQRQEEAKKQARKQELERKHQELKAKQERIRAEREAKQAEERRHREEKEVLLKAEAERKRKEQLEELEKLEKQNQEQHQQNQEHDHGHERKYEQNKPQKDHEQEQATELTTELTAEHKEPLGPISRKGGPSSTIPVVPRDVRGTYPSRLLRPAVSESDELADSSFASHLKGLPNGPSAFARGTGEQGRTSNENLAEKQVNSKNSMHTRGSKAVVKLPNQFATRGSVTLKEIDSLPHPLAAHVRSAQQDPQHGRASTVKNDLMTIKLPGTSALTAKRPSKFWRSKPVYRKKPQKPFTFNKKLRHPRIANTAA